MNASCTVLVGFALSVLAVAEVANPTPFPTQPGEAERVVAALAARDGFTVLHQVELSRGRELGINVHEVWIDMANHEFKSVLRFIAEPVGADPIAELKDWE